MTLATNMNTARTETLMGRIAANLRAARTRRSAYVRTRDELAAMSNYELADIGVTRGMINSVARQAADLAV